MIMYTCIWSRLHSWGHNGFHWHVSAGLLHRKLLVSSNWESLKLPLGYRYMIRWFLSYILHFIDCPVRCNNRHQSCVHLRSTGVNNAFCQCVGFEHRALFCFWGKSDTQTFVGSESARKTLNLTRSQSPSSRPHTDLIPGWTFGSLIWVLRMIFLLKYEAMW